MHSLLQNRTQQQLAKNEHQYAFQCSVEQPVARPIWHGWLVFHLNWYCTMKDKFNMVASPPPERLGISICAFSLKTSNVLQHIEHILCWHYQCLTAVYARCWREVFFQQNINILPVTNVLHSAVQYDVPRYGETRKHNFKTEKLYFLLRCEWHNFAVDIISCWDVNQWSESRVVIHTP